MARVITLLGMHRSGTSLCGSLLQAMGVDMADGPGPSPSNRRGHWERPQINDLNDRIFARFGRGWYDPAHVLALPAGWFEDDFVQSVRAALADYVREAPSPDRPWGFKDPRTARLMPLWRQVFADAGATPRFIFCVRDPAQVARSVTARDKMVAAHAEYRWLVYNAHAVAGIGNDPVCVIPYESWFAQPAETMARLANWLGLAPLSLSALASVIDPEMRHDAPEQTPARPAAARLHRLILTAQPENAFNATLQDYCATLADFEHQVQPLLVDMEVLRVSVTEQNRVIRDLNGAIHELRKTPAAAAAAAASARQD